MKTKEQIESALVDFNYDMKCKKCGNESEYMKGCIWALNWVLGRTARLKKEKVKG